MKQTLDQIQAMIRMETLTNRNEVLKLINLWAHFKTALLKEIAKRPMGDFQQRKEVRDATDRVKMLNIWPWGGALESILEHIGTGRIVEHWNGCINFAREELAKLESKAA